MPLLSLPALHHHYEVTMPSICSCQCPLNCTTTRLAHPSCNKALIIRVMTGGQVKCSTPCCSMNTDTASLYCPLHHTLAWTTILNWIRITSANFWQNQIELNYISKNVNRPFCQWTTKEQTKDKVLHNTIIMKRGQRTHNEVDENTSKHEDAMHRQRD